MELEQVQKLVIAATNNAWLDAAKVLLFFILCFSCVVYILIANNLRLRRELSASMGSRAKVSAPVIRNVRWTI